MQKYNAGALVVYHGKSAQVSAVSADKIEIRIEGGASKSVRAKDIEFLHPGPVSSLPPRALPEPDCCEIMELMEYINSRGTTVIIATHDKEIVNRMRKRVIHLVGGHIVRDSEGGYDL